MSYDGPTSEWLEFCATLHPSWDVNGLVSPAQACEFADWVTSQLMDEVEDES